MGGYGMVVVLADYAVDFVELQRLLGSSEIRLATEAEMSELFPECEVGAMPPFGTVPYVRSGGRDCGAFAIHSVHRGTHRDVIHMSFGDFRRQASGCGCRHERIRGRLRA